MTLNEVDGLLHGLRQKYEEKGVTLVVKQYKETITVKAEADGRSKTFSLFPLWVTGMRMRGVNLRHAVPILVENTIMNLLTPPEVEETHEEAATSS